MATRKKKKPAATADTHTDSAAATADRRIVEVRYCHAAQVKAVLAVLNEKEALPHQEWRAREMPNGRTRLELTEEKKA